MLSKMKKIRKRTEPAPTSATFRRCWFCGRECRLDDDDDIILLAAWYLPSVDTAGDWLAHYSCFDNLKHR